MPSLEDDIREWLRKRSRQTGLGYVATAVAAFLIGFVVCTVTYMVIYGLLFCIMASFFMPDPNWVMIVGFIILVLLFIENARADRSYYDKLSFTSGSASSRIWWIPRVGSNINPLAPDSFRSIVKVICSVLFIGPHLVTSSVQLVLKAARLQRTNFDVCASILLVLLEERKRLPYTELHHRLPGLNPVKALEELKRVDGVLFLEVDPPGVALSSNLRAELKEFRE